MDEQLVVSRILDQYRLNPFGTHGLSHWARVMEIGLALAEKNGADPAVIRYFALFHDSRRRNEGIDFHHGLRGAELATRLREELIDLNDKKFALLITACSDHTKGKTHPDKTIATCWDADRLDLARVGKIPDPSRLCTREAKEPAMIEWASERAARRMIPDRVWNAWQCKRLRWNDRGLPWLDSALMDSITERITETFLPKETPYAKWEEKEIRDFMETLFTLQHFNYQYRQEEAARLTDWITPLIPDTRNTDITRMWLAMALAIKDLYRMRRQTLSTVFAKSRHCQTPQKKSPACAKKGPETT